MRPGSLEMRTIRSGTESVASVSREDKLCYLAKGRFPDWTDNFRETLFEELSSAAVVQQEPEEVLKSVLHGLQGGLTETELQTLFQGVVANSSDDLLLLELHHLPADVRDRLSD